MDLGDVSDMDYSPHHYGNNAHRCDHCNLDDEMINSMTCGDIGYQQKGDTMTESIYERAIKKWGVHNQNDMLIEECSEAIEAICHYRRGKCGMDDVVGELCDVYILLQQMRVIYGESRFDNILDEKIDALEIKIYNKGE